MTPYAPPPKTQTIPVLFEDAELIVVDKPSGLLTVPGRAPEKADCLISRLGSAARTLFIVHRLDMETSGCVVLAKTPEAQKSLSRAFERRAVEKSYVARVFGRIDATSGEIDLPIMKDWPNRPLQKVDEAGKPSQTQWTCLARDGEASRLSLTPLTGRTHQLRVHLNAIGHPILGDLLYGTPESRAAADRLQLHAMQLILPHPADQTKITIDCPAPF